MEVDLNFMHYLLVYVHITKGCLRKEAVIPQKNWDEKIIKSTIKLSAYYEI